MRVEVGLPITVGVARTKFLAKVASGVAKPDGLLVVDPDRERDFLHPLPVTRLWGVGTVTAAKLNRLGIEVVADVARLEEANLVGILGGAAGRHLHALSQLRDPRPVDVARRRRSVGAQRALGRSRTTRDDVEVVVLGLVHRVMGRLRSGGRAARTVTLRARFDDMERISRAASLPQATQSTAEVLAALRRLVRTTWPVLEERGVTLVGISLSNLEPADTLQLTLPFERARPERARSHRRRHPGPLRLLRRGRRVDAPPRPGPRDADAPRPRRAPLRTAAGGSDRSPGRAASAGLAGHRLGGGRGGLGVADDPSGPERLHVGVEVVLHRHPGRQVRARRCRRR